MAKTPNPNLFKIHMNRTNFRLISGLEKLSQGNTVSNSAEKARSKLFKPSQNCSKVKTVTDSQTKALFCSFYNRPYM